MSAHYHHVAFTPAVQAQQERHGSRRFYARREARGPADAPLNDRLDDDVRAYLADRDSFYLATVSETGWPYVQYRGGPPGFLRVLDDHTLGWADFRGNFQYISTGNMDSDGRVALIVMDYPNRRRLKLFGRAVHYLPGDTPEIAARLVDDDYQATVEQIVVVEVTAWDWNCQQHIRPRYTAEELDSELETLRHQVAAFRAQNLEMRRRLAAT